MDVITKELAKDLFARHYNQGRPGLCRNSAETFLNELMPLLIPALGDKTFGSEYELALRLKELFRHCVKLISCVQPEGTATVELESMTRNWFASFQSIERTLDADAEFIAECDPAAMSIEEVKLAYPGFYAIAVHRLSRSLLDVGVRYLPRLFSEIAHSRTGIDIHPGASIGVPFHIDHGTGVVIGESTIIGDRVKVYQGVTLGALAVHKKEKSTKRHPTVEDDCVIYANATILGGKTVIGKGSTIGGSVWLTESVGAGSWVFHRPTLEVKQ